MRKKTIPWFTERGATHTFEFSEPSRVSQLVPLTEAMRLAGFGLTGGFMASADVIQHLLNYAGLIHS